MFPVCLNKKVHKTIWKSVVLKYVARYSVIRANLSHINFKGSARRLLVQRASSRQVLLIEIKAHVVITCTNGVSPNHLPVIVASDRPWTTSLTRAHNKIWRRTESAPQSKRRHSHMAGIDSDCSTRKITGRNIPVFWDVHPCELWRMPHVQTATS